MSYRIEISARAQDAMDGLRGPDRLRVWVHLLTAAQAAEEGAPAHQFGEVVSKDSTPVVLGRTGGAEVVYAIDRTGSRLRVLGLLRPSPQRSTAQ